MKTERKYALLRFLLVIISLIPFSVLDSQEDQRKPSRQAAMDAFSKGEYELALNEFETLLQVYSRDPLYKYYSGVCLVKLNMEPERASGFLREALNGSLDIKSIPDDAWFYLGRSQQMAGRFPDALESYGNFEEKAGKKRAREMDIAKYIQECRDRKTGYEVLAVQKAPPEKKPPQPAVKPVPVKKDVPPEYDRVLSDAMNYQVKADSLNALAADYRKGYDNIAPSQRPAAKARISELESLASEYQRMADEKFGNTPVKPAVEKSAVTREAVPEPVLPETAGSEEIYSLFNVETDPARIRSQKIQIDPEIPAGLVYRIQMGVFSKPLDPVFFKGLSPVSGFAVPGTGSTRYFVGIFRRMEDASRSLLTVKQMGFRDSFITAVLDGKAVSLDRASLMESEWARKPLPSIAPPVKRIDAEASTLVFRIEVTRSSKPLGDETTEAYRKMAGSRGFEIIQADGGTFVYLIGKFITFESASEYADLLKRNGYRDAKISAYLGSREIPVETAKQLFEK